MDFVEPQKTGFFFSHNKIKTCTHKSSLLEDNGMAMFFSKLFYFHVESHD